MAGVSSQGAGRASTDRNHGSRDWWRFGTPVEEAFGGLAPPGRHVTALPRGVSNECVVLLAGVEGSGAVSGPPVDKGHIAVLDGTDATTVDI